MVPESRSGANYWHSVPAIFPRKISSLRVFSRGLATAGSTLFTDTDREEGLRGATCDEHGQGAVGGQGFGQRVHVLLGTDGFVVERDDHVTSPQTCFLCRTFDLIHDHRFIDTEVGQ